LDEKDVKDTVLQKKFIAPFKKKGNTRFASMEFFVLTRILGKDKLVPKNSSIASYRFAIGGNGTQIRART
jgi:hypothetical protein